MSRVVRKSNKNQLGVEVRGVDLSPDEQRNVLTTKRHLGAHFRAREADAVLWET